jgi:uncharacterized protein YbjQ (UPF0145 family)
MPIKGGAMRAIEKMLFILLLFVSVAGCSALHPTGSGDDLPVVLSQDELLRPHIQLGRIQITREVYWMDHALRPNLQEWGLRSLQEEAKRLGADALILPDISSRELAIFIFPGFPATEYRATGIAIKFK